MEIFDISMNIHHNMAVYKNKEEKRPVVSTVCSFSNDGHYESAISMNMHTGTHIDAPLHMVENGGTLGSISLSSTITPCKVLDFTHISDSITKNDLVNTDINSGDFIIFKTVNSNKDEFDFKFVFLEKSGAEYLRDKGVKGVGIDTLGIERDQSGHPTHKLLLSSGIVILEGLRLKDIDAGGYLLIAPPLKIDGVEASPVRALLVKYEK
jgi:arylformamidase